MRRAMAEADVGDDVFGEDPTVNRLQARVAEMLGKEAAVFMPSGSMSNQIGVRLHCCPGDEFLCEAGCHIYNYEQGAFAQLSGVVARPLNGEYGVLRREQLESTDPPRQRTPGADATGVPGEHAQSRQRTDSTVRRGGGSICRWAAENGCATHLDGARLFNAAVATGIAADRWAKHFDTVSVCFSKGLGAPVGSALAGPRDLMTLARRHRKLFGGRMRQAGVIAAGGTLCTRPSHRPPGRRSCQRSTAWGSAREIEGLELSPAEIDTNIVIFAVSPALGDAGELAARLQSHGLLVLAIGPQTIRAVTHLDVNADDVEQAGVILRRAVEEMRSGHSAPAEPAEVC